MKNYAIITGASQGIGKNTAQYFLQQNWSVINISRRNCDIPQVINFNLDLAKKDWENAYREKLSALIKSPEKICLIHNAAAYQKDNIRDIETQSLRTVLEVNIVAPLLLNQIFLSKMANGSSIIYIGSTLSEKAVANAASYVISKHSVAGMMRATCQDLIKYPDIHTCCVCPGFTETEMMKQHQSGNPELIANIKNRVAAKRLIQPEEIASLIYYCANNPVINGSMIHANLGQIED